MELCDLYPCESRGTKTKMNKTHLKPCAVFCILYVKHSIFAFDIHLFVFFYITARAGSSG